MGADFNKPTTTDHHATVYTPGIRDNLQALAKALDPAKVTVANLPVDTIVWSSANKRWERWTGATLVNNEPAGGYAISISGNAATATQAGHALTSGSADSATSIADGAVSSAAKIANGVVSLVKMAAINTAKLLGRSSSGSGAPEEISIGTGLQLSGGTLNCTVTAPVSSVVGLTGAITATHVRDALLAVDGHGNGLDADLLDGQHASAFAPASGGNYAPLTAFVDATYLGGTNTQSIRLTRANGATLDVTTYVTPAGG